MESKAEKAMALFREGYNCAQAVFGAFSEELGLDLETAMRMSSSFGGGMGRLREVCGAVSAMFLAAGLRCGYASATDKTAKDDHYRRIQELAERFTEKRGTIVCRELLDLREKKSAPVSAERTPDFYTTRPCMQIIGEAAQILDEFLREHPVGDGNTGS